MCLNNQSPRPPEIQRVTPPPPAKQLQIAQTSTLPTKQITKKEKKDVAFGAKSLRSQSKMQKSDAASLLVPLNSGSTGTGGINT